MSKSVHFHQLLLGSYPSKIYISNEQLLYQFLVLKKLSWPKISHPALLGVSRRMGEGTGALALSPEALLVKYPRDT